MKTRNQIFAENPIEDYCAGIGIVLKGNGNERMAKCPFHEDGSPSFSVNITKQLWTCRAGCGGGSVLDLMARHEGVSVGAILTRLGNPLEGWKPPVKQTNRFMTPHDTSKPPVAPVPTVKPKLVKTYDYRNAAGELVYQACRLEPKSFRQRRPAGEGKWYWNMEGIERVLYQLPKVLKTKTPVCVCFKPDTELLTPTGWKMIADCNGQKVCQYHRTSGEVDFALPLAYQNFDYSGDMVCFHHEFCRLEVTPDHRMLVDKSGRGVIQVLAANDVHSRYQLPTSGVMLASQDQVTPYQARLIAAFQADGQITNQHREKEGNPTAWQHPAWNLKKERKKQRLREILSAVGVEWIEHIYPSCPEWTHFTVRRQDVLWMLDRLSDDAFLWSTLNWPIESRYALLEELGYWDGDFVGKNGVRFFTSSEQSSDVVCAVAVCSGWSVMKLTKQRNRSTYKCKPEHIVSLIRNKKWRGGSNTPTLEPYVGKVNCVTVPSGFLITRRNGKVCIAGNCEGEKDCDNITALGAWVGTTNVAGAGKWLDAYADVLVGKDVILCGDNDKPGKEHMDKVFASLAGKAKSVTVVTIPAPSKDVSDWLATLPDDLEQRHNAFAKLVNDSPCFDKGLDIPVQSMAEMEREMKRSVETAGTRSFTFEGWLPGFASVVRPIVPGEIISLIAATKVGKTAIGQALSRHAAPLKVLYFSQELPSSLMFERYAASVTGMRAADVYQTYKQGGTVDWRGTGKLDHIYCCPKTRLAPEQILDILKKSQLKIGEEVALWVVDYAQLAGGAKDRYDRVSDLMEGCKAIAKETRTIGVVLSQRGRGGKDEEDRFQEVHLTDAKESGSVENSSGLVLGAWRTEGDETALNLKVLANTKGLAGKQIVCNFDGERMTITERSPVSDEDVPVQAPQETTTTQNETMAVPVMPVPYED